MKKTFSIHACVSITVLFISVGGGETVSRSNAQRISPADNNQNLNIVTDYGKMPLFSSLTRAS